MKFKKLRKMRLSSLFYRRRYRDKFSYVVLDINNANDLIKGVFCNGQNAQLYVEEMTIAWLPEGSSPDRLYWDEWNDRASSLNPKIKGLHIRGWDFRSFDDPGVIFRVERWPVV